MPAATAETNRPATADPVVAFTIPSRLYTSPEVFAEEREAVFFRTWQYVGHAEDVREPGAYKTVHVLDQSILVVRGRDRVLRAFYNVCSHRAHELLSGEGTARMITCPYHAWTYALDGSLRNARRAENVPGFNTADYCLKPVRVEEFGPLVFVNLDPDAVPLAEQAGGLLRELKDFVPDFDKLTKVSTKSWEVKANWKVVIDNFLECYHCETAHPALCKLIDMDSYKSVTHDIYSTHLSRSGSPDNDAYSFDPGAGSQVGAFWWLWPTTTISVGPGEPNMVMFYVRPLGPDRSIEIADYYYADRDISGDDEASAQRLARLSYANDVLQAEDNALVEGVQRGLTSRAYSRGRFMIDGGLTHNSEHAVLHFHQLVSKALGVAL